ncbi:hypothetical protein HYH03_006241 [Edaphochlamys debaryana]|uniref:SURP and G-patch domain-containing protein 1-like protein n=1 Tax=Edaphochlamys debaryana TaxID=47281 RepID=A0A836C0B2_9CHLO|nr:hypothetical protein HYH03_006241 [Edaphochlamys debaryana]|eukprot:KAG2495641.1 hypothetical protein HYH03_006241 [Edaphochlamys debaryana]
MAMGPAKPKPTVGDLFGGHDSDEEQDAKKQRTEPRTASQPSGLSAELTECAAKLAEFVAKNGRQYEDMTRDRNPGDTPFKFLHDKSSPGYQFYLSKLREFESGASGSGRPAAPPPPPPAPAGPSGSRFSSAVPSGPSSSALPPDAAAAVAAAIASAKAAAAAAAAAGRLGPGPDRSRFGSPPAQAPPLPVSAEQAAEARRRAEIALAKGDTVAAVEAFTVMAAQRDRERSASADPDDPDGEERRKPEPLLNKTAFERRKTTAVFKDDGSRGHHMGDYIPKEVLAEFMAKGGDKVAAAQAEQLANKNAIGSDNIGHKLLSKMGWKEGEGLGGSQKGITAPIKAAAAAAPAAGEARGLGAQAVHEPTAEDDVYEQYRKRMMLGYKFRPNPLGNPRRAYY